MEVKPGYRQTEIGILPLNWGIRTLRSMTSLLTNGFVGKATDHYVQSDDGVLYIQGYNIEENNFNLHGIKRVSKEFHNLHKKSCLQCGDLLTIQTGDIGVTAVVPEYLAGANCHALIISRFFKDSIDPFFYCHYFNSEKIRSQFKEIETGTTMKHLNVGDLAVMQFPVPPLPEQRTIATALSDADARITSLDQLIAKKRDIRQAATQELLTGKRRLPGFNSCKGFKQTEVGVIPKDWNIRKISDFSPLQRGFDLPIYHYKSGPHPVVYSNGIMRRHEKAMVKGPGVVTGRSGTIGKVQFIEEDYWPHNTTLWVTNFKGNDPRFVYYSYQRFDFGRFSSGSGVPTLNRNDFHSFSIAVPSPEEQRAIATVLSDMDAELAALEQQRDKMKNIKQGMMQELLTGRIRLV